MSQLALLPHFDGPGLTPADEKRLGTALHKVWKVMRDGGWYTLAELARRAKCSEAGAAARTRDFRKEKFAAVYPNGGVDKRSIGNGLYEYRLVPAGEVRR